MALTICRGDIIQSRSSSIKASASLPIRERRLWLGFRGFDPIERVDEWAILGRQAKRCALEYMQLVKTRASDLYRPSLEHEHSVGIAFVCELEEVFIIER